MESMRWLIHHGRWDATRQLGWRRYVFHQTLRITTTMLLAKTCLFLLLLRTPMEFSAHRLTFDITVFFCLGLTGSVVEWWIRERLYLRPRNHFQDTTQ
jgi:hypothetical protein